MSEVNLRLKSSRSCEVSVPTFYFVSLLKYCSAKAMKIE